MKAVTYQGIKNVEVKEVEDPKILKPDDMIIKVTSTAICGSDLHLIHGMMPNLQENYVIGHEPMGIVEEVGPEVTKVKKGDRVIIPFNIACGECQYCKSNLESQCDNSNDNGDVGAYFGYSGNAGGYPGGQAEYLRVPFANFTHFKIPETCEEPDEKLTVIADAMTTGFWSVDNAGVKAGDTVIVFGCGPIGLFAQKFAWLKGAKRVIAVDYVDYRLQHAKRTNKVEIVNFEQVENVGAYLKELTKGGADVVIDAVGMDGKMSDMEFLASGMKLQGGTMSALVMAAQAVRKCGTIQITGVYGGRYNAFPLGDIMQRNVNIRSGQAPVIHYMPYMFELVSTGKIDPSDVVSHVLPLSEAKRGYEIFDTKMDNCIKVVLKP
ncbi:putative alcohol dehydrogenase [Niallia circulans]|jgi:S-(hydroxymethyl)glutathione dehydrogenase / alcohol dehydrogenase|uniref:Dehydrogenase n=1 Tax=Niallia circulans TaxID=1397 RepID=A0A0J1L7A5_NIACI|nr:zinc-dependent alcohol dehydrogenase [Niallia circulans]KLV24785.1 dehydrogenase [Niallia circulans]MCM2980188.1 glutathione-dependent formaldehyde dehydrogenase [Niallia circulans]MDR4315189.1 glutathione-dependent formaldehyde dehydrogenase [Niallia circulans]MED3839925.1 glutathione-dependent formaldehyde dehydrogenase [Niallia circulans]MED4241411.1 glutathione-dependent formaldehyde dehydrogenase [Niallia circulans]